MNNKLFTFLDPLLGYIDNGRFFREPFRWLYVIFAVLNLLFPIFILAKIIEMDFFKYAEGKLILAFILLFIILCAGAWGKLSALDEPENKLKEAYSGRNAVSEGVCTGDPFQRSQYCTEMLSEVSGPQIPEYGRTDRGSEAVPDQPGGRFRGEHRSGYGRWYPDDLR